MPSRLQRRSQAQPTLRRTHEREHETSYSRPYANPSSGSRGYCRWYRYLCQELRADPTPTHEPGPGRNGLGKTTLLKALLADGDGTGVSPAEIDPKPGGAFSLFGGMVVGRNIELVPNQRIVQAWRVVADFPDGVYTMVKFELIPRDSQTSVILDQTGFAEGDFDHLSLGWHSHYWEPLKIFLAKP